MLNLRMACRDSSQWCQTHLIQHWPPLGHWLLAACNEAEEKDKESKAEKQEPSEEDKPSSTAQGRKHKHEATKERVASRKRQNADMAAVINLVDKDEEDISTKPHKQPVVCKYAKGNTEEQWQQAAKLLAPDLELVIHTLLLADVHFVDK